MFDESGHTLLLYHRQLEKYLAERSKDGRRTEENPNATPARLRRLCECLVDMMCNNFEVEGVPQIRKFIAGHPGARFLVSSSHLSNLDAPAAVKALGGILNMQITAESLLFQPNMPQYYMFKLAGRENFLPLSYQKVLGGKKGVFSPSNLQKVAEKIESGKTPWIAAQPFTTERKMLRAKIGPVYLAAKADSYIIPTALEYKGPYRSLEGAVELLKGTTGKVFGSNQVVYHIGEPINFGSISGLEVLATAETRKLTLEENETLKIVLAELRRRADILGEKIAEMLPEENRGYYEKMETAAARI